MRELSMKPSDYLRRQVRVTPFPGEDVAELVKISSPELYLFSSDYPHPEGTKDPIGHFERSFDERPINQSARDAFMLSLLLNRPITKAFGFVPALAERRVGEDELDSGLAAPSSQGAAP